MSRNLENIVYIKNQKQGPAKHQVSTVKRKGVSKERKKDQHQPRKKKEEYILRYHNDTQKHIKPSVSPPLLASSSSPQPL